jgi:hypothetical protein
MKIYKKIKFAGSRAPLSVKRKIGEKLQKKHSNNGENFLSLMPFVYLHVRFCCGNKYSFIYLFYYLILIKF